MKPLAKPLAIEPAGLITPSITTPDKVESRIGTLEFTDGMPSQDTLAKVYDNCSQSYPSPAAEPNADGSTTVYFAPAQPDGVARGNWIQTIPGKKLVRVAAPLQPARAVLRQDLATERGRAGPMS